MNEAAAATMTLLVMAGIFYGCWKFVENSEVKYQSDRESWKALYERQVVALENLAIESPKGTGK